MRVDPNYVTKLSGLLSQSSSNEARLTMELSSGLRVAKLSDDPVASSQNAMLTASISRMDSFTQSSNRQQGMLQVADSTLGQVVSQLTSALSLAASAGNSTLNTANLKAFADQVTGIRDQVLQLANTSYLGQYLFSGSKGDTAPFSQDTTVSPATVTYQGDGITQNIETPSGQQVQLNVSGADIFTAPGADVLGTLNQLIADLNNGDATAVAADASSMTSVIANVSGQRSVIDNSLTQLTATSNYTATQETQLKAQQSALLSADPSQVATDLKTAETQRSSILSVIAIVGKENLFDYLR